MSRFYDDDFGSTPTIFDIVRSLARPVSEFADHIDSTFKDDEAEAGDSFRADLCDLGDHYELKAELPGVRKEDIEMSFNDGVLSVKAKHNTDCCCKSEDGECSEGAKAAKAAGDGSAAQPEAAKAERTGHRPQTPRKRTGPVPGPSSSSMSAPAAPTRGASAFLTQTLRTSAHRSRTACCQ